MKRVITLFITLAILITPLTISGVAPNENYTSQSISDEPLVFKRGIDVSFWQNDIDWEKVAAAGVDFAMLRIGAGALTTRAGEFLPDRVDERFYEYIKGASANNIEVGVYWYSYAQTLDEMHRELAFLLPLLEEAAHRFDITYPIVLDMEEEREWYDDNPSEMAAAFLKTLVSNGYFPMIYSFRSWLSSNLSSEIASTYAIWVAHWGVAQTSLQSGNYYMWQYTDSGRVSGIDGNVDLNIAYRDFAEFTRRHGLNRLS